MSCLRHWFYFVLTIKAKNHSFSFWRFSCRGVESSPSRDRKQKQRFFLGHQGLNPPLIQQYSSGSISPNRVAVSTNTEQHPALPLFGSSSDNKKSRAIPVPPPPTTQSSRARNSVEGFNTEIEKLVCRGNGETTSNKVSTKLKSQFNKWTFLIVFFCLVCRWWNRRRMGIELRLPNCLSATILAAVSTHKRLSKRTLRILRQVNIE